MRLFFVPTKIARLEIGMTTPYAGRRLCQTCAISKPVGNFQVHGNKAPLGLSLRSAGLTARPISL
jgi:hypothetical protein